MSGKEISLAPPPLTPVIDLDAAAEDLLRKIQILDMVGTVDLKDDDKWFENIDAKLESEDIGYIMTLMKELEEQRELAIKALDATTPKTPIPKTPEGLSAFGQVGDNSFVCPESMYLLLKKGRNHFQRQYGVKLLIPPLPEDEDAVVVEVLNSDPDTIAEAINALYDILKHPKRFQRELDGLAKQNTHIVVDNSNILKGAQIVGFDPKEKKTNRDTSIRVNVKALHELVNNSRNCMRSFVGGSLVNPVEVKDPSKSFWVKHWRAIGYKVHAISIGIDQKEWGVDSAIVADIVLHIHNVEKRRLAEAASGITTQTAADRPMDTLVMLTGDGNDNDQQASLFQAVEYALDKNWCVELWCWVLSVSNNYRILASKLQERPNFRLFFLDKFRDEITFKT
jgi:hypothetical protein